MDGEAKTLGTVDGLCACYSKETLNGRSYDKIYKKILAGEDFRFNEMMRRGGILAEFGHPAQITADFERTETDPEKACVIITEVKERENGKIYAKGKILDTPAGRIYKAISPFYTFGFSSRGSYEAIDDFTSEGPDGWNQDSYIFKGFDVVALPANEGSTISVTESLNSSKKIKSARESLDLNELASATEVDAKEIERELDKIFNKDGDIDGSELVSIDNYSEIAEDENSDKEELTEEEIIEEEPASKIAEIENSIKRDLEVALTESERLKQELETTTFNYKNKEAEVAELRAQNIELQGQIEELEKVVEDYLEIKELSQKLLNSYDLYSTEVEDNFKVLKSDKELAEEELSAVERKAQQLSSEKNKALIAIKQVTEQLQQEKQSKLKIKAELCSAKEALIELHSKSFGVSKESLSKRLGSSYKVFQIKSAAESLVKDNLRLSQMVIPEVKPSQVVWPSRKQELEASDEVERELLEMLYRD